MRKPELAFALVVIGWFAVVAITITLTSGSPGVP
jgi:hypothetical protein